MSAGKYQSLLEAGSSIRIILISSALNTWAVSLELSAKIRLRTIREAYVNFLLPKKREQITQLVVDGGPENQGEVNAFVSLEHIPIRKITALVDIDFSNSMVEAVNKVVKYQFLYHQKLADIDALEKYLQIAVPVYNSKKPHSALKGHTPEQMLKEKQIDFGIIKEQVQDAIRNRIEVNRTYNCGVC